MQESYCTYIGRSVSKYNIFFRIKIMSVLNEINDQNNVCFVLEKLDFQKQNRWMAFRCCKMFIKNEKTFGTNGLSVAHSPFLKVKNKTYAKMSDFVTLNILKVIRGGRHSSVVSSAPTILQPWVWIPSTPSMLFQFVLLKLQWKKNENEQKRGRDWPIF